VRADPDRLAQSETLTRDALGYPPFGALVEVSGAAADAFIEGLGRPLGLEIRGPLDGRYRVRAPDHQVLCDALAGAPRPAGRLRVAVDPLRI
jgi:hypothetical protein